MNLVRGANLSRVQRLVTQALAAKTRTGMYDNLNLTDEHCSQRYHELVGEIAEVTGHELNMVYKALDHIWVSAMARGFTYYSFGDSNPVTLFNLYKLGVK